MASFERQLPRQPDHRVFRWKNNLSQRDSLLQKLGLQKKPLLDIDPNAANPQLGRTEHQEPVIGVTPFHELGSQSGNGAKAPTDENTHSAQHERRILRTKEVKQGWQVRRIEPSDIQEISEWFKDKKVKSHIGNDKIDPYIPADWNNEEQVLAFKDALHSFYFPQQPFAMELKTPPHKTGYGSIVEADLGDSPKEVMVNQITNVCTINEKGVDYVAAVQSYVTDDPFAPQEVRKEIIEGKEKAAHGLVLITNPAFRHLRVASFMTFVRSDEVLGTDPEHPGEFTQISGLVSYVEEWAGIVKFFKGMGYELDRDPDGHDINQIINGAKQYMERIVLGQKKWWAIRELVSEQI